MIDVQRDPIERWLGELDDTAHVPQMPADLAERVRVGLQHRRRNRRAGAVLGATLLLAGAGVTLHSFRTGGGTPPNTIARAGDGAFPSDIEAELRELKELEKQAFATLDRMSEAARGEPVAAEPADPMQAVDEAVERAAQLLVYQGDRLREELNLAEQAADSYQSAIELFPSTRAAQTARERLGQIRS